MTPKRFSKAPILDPLVQVRRINQTWLVRGGLDVSTERYLEHLGKVDPKRLTRSCRIALNVLHSVMEVQDPKVLFYPGVFLLATAEEVELFLAEHPYTRGAIALARCRYAEDGSVEPVDEVVNAQDKLGRVANTLVKAIHQVCPEDMELPPLVEAREER